MSSLERRVRELRSCFALFIYLFIYLYLYGIYPFSKADINRGPDKWLNTWEYNQTWNGKMNYTVKYLQNNSPC